MVGAALRMVSMLREGLFTPPVLNLAIWAALPVLVTLMIGTVLLRGVTTEKLRQSVFLFIAAIALKYLILA
jgi:hypothetical protein